MPLSLVGSAVNAADLLVVCTGNVCRSPLVERVLQGVLDERYGAGAVRVRSAGTMGLEGHAMDERSAGVLGGFGGTADGFVARRLVAPMLQEAALVVTSTVDHRTQVSRLDPRSMKKTFTLRELAGVGEHVADDQLPTGDDPVDRLRQVAVLAKGLRGLRTDALDVIDPYRQGDEVYAQMRDEIAAALPGVTRLLRGA